MVFEKLGIVIKLSTYFSWIISSLKTAGYFFNQYNLEYHLEPRYDKRLRYFINTSGYEEKFLVLHPYIKDFRDLKEEYVRFNSRNADNPLKAAEEIDPLIYKYCSSEYKIFIEFGNLLRKYKNPIINSFIMVERLWPNGIYNSRLSNGPIESLNRKAMT